MPNLTNTYIAYNRLIGITENRAPTDDSIRLYKEMEEKAEKNIIAKETFQDNKLNGTVVFVEKSPAFDNITAHIIFSLNGKEYHEKISVERMILLNKEEIARLLYKSIIEKLAEVFTIEFYKIEL